MILEIKLIMPGYAKGPLYSEVYSEIVGFQTQLNSVTYNNHLRELKQSRTH